LNNINDIQYPAFSVYIVRLHDFQNLTRRPTYKNIQKIC